MHFIGQDQNLLWVSAKSQNVLKKSLERINCVVHYIVCMCRVPVGLPDVGHYPELFVALLDTGTWSLEDLSKLAGLNFLRVLKDVEKVNIN